MGGTSLGAASTAKGTKMITIDQMVQREVNCCLSSLVSTLAGGYGESMGLGRPAKELEALAEQAFELASPIPDYEEAAIEQGWRVDSNAHFVHAGGTEAEASPVNA